MYNFKFLTIKKSVFGILLTFLASILLNFVMLLYIAIFRPNCVNNYVDNCQDIPDLIERFGQIVPFFNFLFLIIFIYCIFSILFQIKTGKKAQK